MVTNRRLVTLDQDDLYPTPEWATEALIDVETFTGDIVEPACGDGSMSRVLARTGNTIHSYDLYDHGYGLTGYDFFDWSDAKIVPNIITNPPYNVADAFVLKSLKMTTGKVAMLVRLAYLEGQDRWKTIYGVQPPSRVWVFSERITFYKKNADVKGSGTTAYAWFVWDKEDLSGKTELKWFEPKYKPKKVKNAKS